jgi:hypothetical protein
MAIPVVSTEGPFDFAQDKLRPEWRDLLTARSSYSSKQGLSTSRGVYPEVLEARFGRDDGNGHLRMSCLQMGHRAPADLLEFLVFFGRSGAGLENAGFQGPNRFSGIFGILAGLHGHRSPRYRHPRVWRHHRRTATAGRDIRAISANFRERSADAFNAHFSRHFSIIAICAISASLPRPGQRRRAQADRCQGNRARRSERPWCGAKARHRGNVRSKTGEVKNYRDHCLFAITKVSSRSKRARAAASTGHDPATFFAPCTDQTWRITSEAALEGVYKGQREPDRHDPAPCRRSPCALRAASSTAAGRCRLLRRRAFAWAPPVRRPEHGGNKRLPPETGDRRDRQECVRRSRHIGSPRGA